MQRRARACTRRCEPQISCSYMPKRRRFLVQHQHQLADCIPKCVAKVAVWNRSPRMPLRLPALTHAPTHPRNAPATEQQPASLRVCMRRHCQAKSRRVHMAQLPVLDMCSTRPRRNEWRSGVQFISHRADRVRERPVFMHARPTPIEAAIPARRFCCGVSFHFLHSLLKLAIP